MLPVVRLINPDAYVIERARLVFSGSVQLVDKSKWPELQRLDERLTMFRFPEDYEGLTDEELIDCFDREMDTNPYLTRPNAAAFRAWEEFRIQIPGIYDGELSESTAEHYYSYWQVHQLHYIQKFPELYRYRRLFEYLPDDVESTLGLRSPNVEYFVDFKGMHRYFDALSYWMTVYARERGRTFATVDEENGFRQLSDAQANVYRAKLEAHADTVLANFNLCSNDLYGFLRQLISLYDAYTEDERHTLAEELKSDIWHLSNLIELKTRANREQVGAALNYYQGRTFRHLNEVSKERDYAVSVMKRVADRCAVDLQGRSSSWSFAESEINELLDYCEEEGLGLLRTALSGMLAIGDEEHHLKFRRVTRYSNLKNILSSYEYLLKSIGDKASLGIGGSTLTPSVRTAMANETWLPWFDIRSGRGRNSVNLLHARDTTQFIHNLATILSDGQLNSSVDGYWAQTFLFALSARNGTVHFYPEEDRYYGELFGAMLNTPIIAMFYTWKLAKHKQWI